MTEKTSTERAKELADRINAHLAQPGGVVEWQRSALGQWEPISKATAFCGEIICHQVRRKSLVMLRPCSDPALNDFSLQFRTEGLT